MTRAHNTRVSARRIGCRLPCETASAGEAYEAYQPPGKLNEYTLSREEIERRYGPVNTKARRKRLDRDALAELLKTLTVGQVAMKYDTPQHLVFKLVEKYGLELDEKNRLKGDGQMTAAF